MKTFTVQEEEKSPRTLQSSTNLDSLLVAVGNTCTSCSKAGTTPFASKDKNFARLINDKPAPPQKKSTKIKRMVARARHRVKVAKAAKVDLIASTDWDW